MKSFPFSAHERPIPGLAFSRWPGRDGLLPAVRHPAPLFSCLPLMILKCLQSGAAGIWAWGHGVAAGSGSWAPDRSWRDGLWDGPRDDAVMLVGIDGVMGAVDGGRSAVEDDGWRRTGVAVAGLLAGKMEEGRSGSGWWVWAARRRICDGWRRMVLVGAMGLLGRRRQAAARRRGSDVGLVLPIVKIAVGGRRRRGGRRLLEWVWAEGRCRRRCVDRQGRRVEGAGRRWIVRRRSWVAGLGRMTMEHHTGAPCSGGVPYVVYLQM
ncbi:hypothetical protein ACLOJK_006328 [Asimina triloba]